MNIYLKIKTKLFLFIVKRQIINFSKQERNLYNTKIRLFETYKSVLHEPSNISIVNTIKHLEKVIEEVCFCLNTLKSQYHELNEILTIK